MNVTADRQLTLTGGMTFGGGPLLAHVAHHVVQRLSDPALLQHARSRARLSTQAMGWPQIISQVEAIWAGLLRARLAADL